MGLLDALLQQGEPGGLFSNLYQSPLLQPPQQQFTGNEFDAYAPNKTQLNPLDPFGGMPQQPQVQANAPGGWGSPTVQMPSFIGGGTSPFAMGTPGVPIMPAQADPQQQPQIVNQPPNVQQQPTDISSQNVQPTHTLDVGGYQMPQFGNAAAQQSAPQSVQQAPSQSQPTPSLAPDSPSFGDKLLAGFTNFGAGGKSGGLIGALAGASTGFSTGQRQDAQGLQQQQMSATFQSLVSSGVPKNLAMAATLNPKILEQIAPAYFDKAPKLQETGTDPLTGQKTFAQQVFKDGKLTLEPVAAGGASSATDTTPTMATLQKAQQAGVTGSALYDYLPKSMAPMVQAMIEGRQPLPSPQAMRNPATLALIDAAHAIDPTFDATSWASRQAGAKDFTSGKSSEMVRAANQTLAHVGSLLDSMDSLNNGRVPAANAVGNFFSEQTGDGRQGSFRTNAHAVAEEMSKVFKGANLSDSEIKQWEQNLTENMSPAQQKAQVGKLSELLHGSLAALEEKRTAAIGPMAAEKAGPIIKAEGQKTLDRIDAWVKNNGTSGQPINLLPEVGKSTTINGVSVKRIR